jgi:hypothetical protein
VIDYVIQKIFARRLGAASVEQQRTGKLSFRTRASLVVIFAIVLLVWAAGVWHLVNVIMSR